MFKRYLILSAIIFLATFSYAQNLDNGSMPRIGMGRNMNPNDNIQSLSNHSASKIPTEHFLDDEWSFGELSFDGGSKIKALPFKIDLLNEYVLVKTETKAEKVLPFTRLDSAIVQRPNGIIGLFVTKVDGIEGTTLRGGVFEILTNVNNAHALIIQYDAEVVQPTNKMAMDNGIKKTTSRLQTEKFFFYKDKVYPISRRKKKFVRQFNQQEGAIMLKRIKALNTNLKDRSSLLRFIESLE